MESSMLLSLQSFGLAAVLNSRLLGFWVPSLAVCGLAAIRNSRLLGSWVPSLSVLLFFFAFKLSTSRGPPPKSSSRQQGNPPSTLK